jgi:hypothetical protein
MRKTTMETETDTPQVVPSVTDEDPMTSRRVTRQPRKQNPAAAALGRLASLKSRAKGK